MSDTSTAMMSVIAELRTATDEYADASAEVLAATIAESDAQDEFRDEEAAIKHEAHTSGALGTNDKQRAAALAVILNTHPGLKQLAAQHEAAEGRKARADHRFRVAYQRMESSRCELKAFTALVAHV